jgi:2-polyprenyl-3-methyl-5-hydroxy-6-metoxy-1,4-benzoquinol methylase
VSNLNVPTESSAREAYDNWHAALGIDAANETPWHRIVRAHLPVESLKGLQILEIGCGRGDFSCWLAQQLGDSAKVVAADFSTIAINKACEYARSLGLSVDWQVMDIQNIARADGSFDVVFSCETIEHVLDPARAVRRHLVSHYSELP